jgi:hypothetical protein
VSRHVDRGWAIERSWDSRIGSDLRLRDWIDPIREHRMPIAVFNATLAETGQRLLISPVLKKRTDHWTASEACEFFNLYPDYEANPLVTTAVRLSATFPYVSPISRPDAFGIAAEKQYHVADGGYAENGGIFTVLDWANELVRHNQDRAQRSFDRIVIVRILPFLLSDQPATAKPSQGWTYEVLGPIDTIQNVRIASQAERNDFDLELLTTPMEAFPNDNDGTIPIFWTSFMFKPREGYVAPLSWHLTTSQKEELRQAWNDLIGGSTPRAVFPAAGSAATKTAHRLPVATERSLTALDTLDQFFDVKAR